MKKIITSFFFLLYLLLLVAFVFAAPAIEIHSPQNITYETLPIPINVTANETVDFYVKGVRGRIIMLAENVTSFEDNIYAKRGAYTFTIFANTSEGVTNYTVNYSLGSPMPPINITSCGFLASSNVDYVVQQDLVDTTTPFANRGVGCVWVKGITNSTIDLNGHSITSGGNRAILLSSVSNVILKNGTLQGGLYDLDISGSKLRVQNLTLLGPIGIYIFIVDGVLIEDIIGNNSYHGIVNIQATNTIVKDSVFAYDGNTTTNQFVQDSGFEFRAGFWDYSYATDIIFENVSFQDYPNKILVDGIFSDIFLRSTNVKPEDIDSIYHYTLGTRIYEQHELKLNVTDEIGNSIPSTIVITDNGNISRVTEEESTYTMFSNPTAEKILATENNTGTTREDVWVSKNLLAYQTDDNSNFINNSYIFDPYNVSVMSRNASVNFTFEILGNSTFFLNATLDFPEAGVAPACTTAQQFDLDGDNDVDIQDAILILRYITNKSITTNATKGCTAITFSVP